MADPLKSNVGAADPSDPNHHKYIRGLRSTDQLMRQFLKLESGAGNSSAFQRGHVWNFEWCSEDPTKAQPERVRRVQHLMRLGWAFDEAFDHVRGHPCDEPLPAFGDCLCADP
jgi:hypothetical protein